MCALSHTAVANDKDYGYSVMTTSDFVDAHRSVLAVNSYVAISTLSINVDTMISRYVDLSCMVQKLEGDPKVGAATRRSLMIPNGSMFAQLQILCKSHKPSGSVKRGTFMRPRLDLRGGSLWVQQEFQKYTGNLPHILPWSGSSSGRLTDVAASGSPIFALKYDRLISMKLSWVLLGHAGSHMGW